MTPRRRAPARRGKAPDERINALIPGVLRQVERRHTALFAIQQRWTRLVGRRLAAHTRPISLRRSQLVVQVDRPGDGFALRYERPAVLDRIRALGGAPVDDLVIRPAG